MNAPFPSVKNSILLIVDVQERLMPVIREKDKTIHEIQKLIDGATALGLDIIITEQYPKGLGRTVSELKYDASVPVIAKNSFSCLPEPEIRQTLIKKDKKHLILCGAESHICVLKTALEAVHLGYTVHVVADAVSSRTPENKVLALERLRQSGVYIVSTEMILFMLLDCAGTPEFKSISKIIK